MRAGWGSVVEGGAVQTRVVVAWARWLGMVGLGSVKMVAARGDSSGKGRQ